MLQSLLRQAYRLLRREAASGELRLLLLALVIGVASPASVSFFADRLDRALDQRRAHWLGGDLLINTGRPPRDEWLREAQAQGLEHTQGESFRSVVVAGEAMTLTEIKAVDDAYPLRGQMELKFDYPGEAVALKHAPARDEAWVEPLLLAKLGLKIGDQLQLGKLNLKVSAVIHEEPDRGLEIFNLAPRVLINRAVVPESGLIQPGSRIKYRFTVAGEEDAVLRFRRAVEPGLVNGEQLVDNPEERSQAAATLERAEKFLRLVSLTGFILAAVAVGMSAHRYALRHLRVAAIYRCLGASAGWVGRLYLLQLLLLGLVGSLLGGLVGWLAQWVLDHFLGVLFALELPAAGPQPLLLAVLSGVVLTLGFGFAPLHAIHQLRPAEVLRGEAPPPRASWLLLYLPPVAVVVAIMLVQSGSPQMTGLMLAGLAGTLVFLIAGALLLIRLARRFSPRGRVVYRFALLGITRRSSIGVLQVASVGVGLMVLLVLTLVSRDLLQGWRASVPPDAPNHFAINIQANQTQPMAELLRANGVVEPSIHPMIRGRLVSINGRPVSADDYENARAQRLVRREFNLSYNDQLPPYNRVVAGEAWDASSEPGRWSVESGIASTLGMEVGDTLVFDVAGSQVSGRVANLREVSWDSFQVNFFVIAAPGLLDPSQASYITAFHLPAGSEEVLLELVKRFPNLTEINVEVVLQQVRTIIEQVTRSIEFVSLFTLLAGFLVLFAAVRTSLDERLHENAILRVLGASRGEIQRALLLEFLLLGVICGLLAAAGAWLVGWLLATRAFNMSFDFYSALWLVGPLVGAVGMTLAGWWSTRAVVNSPPLRVMGAVAG